MLRACPAVLLVALAALPVSAGAQSPLTTFYSRNNAGAPGGLIAFDTHVVQAISITGLDCNFGQPAGTAGSVDVFTVPGTLYGNESNAAGWTWRGTGVVAAAGGVDRPSRAAFASPIGLSAGHWGFAIVCGPNLDHEYTSGVHPGVFSTAELWIETGIAQNIPFSNPTFTPREWNGAIHYVVPPPPTSSSFGSGCGPAGGRLQLGVSAAPAPGALLRLDTTRMPSLAPFGATVLGLAAFPGGIPLAPIGMPDCNQYVGLDAVLAFVPSGATASVPFAVPPGYGGLHVFCQSIVFARGFNPFGAITSNALDLAL